MGLRKPDRGTGNKKADWPHAKQALCSLNSLQPQHFFYNSGSKKSGKCSINEAQNKQKEESKTAKINEFKLTKENQ